MGAVIVPDDLKQVSGRHVAEGRAASETDFVIEAIQRYAEALDFDEISAAADDAIADIEAGRCQVISGPEDMARLQSELGAKLDELAKRPGLASSE